MEGLPISNSSNFLTRLASVYLDGGDVKDSTDSIESMLKGSPTFTESSMEKASSASSSCML